MRVFLFVVLGVVLFTSCKKVRKCECKTEWIEYSNWGPVDKELVTLFPIKDTKQNAKAECDVIASGQPQTGGYYTACKLVK